MGLRAGDGLSVSVIELSFSLPFHQSSLCAAEPLSAQPASKELFPPNKRESVSVVCLATRQWCFGCYMLVVKEVAICPSESCEEELRNRTIEMT